MRTQHCCASPRLSASLIFLPNSLQSIPTRPSHHLAFTPLHDESLIACVMVTVFSPECTFPDHEVNYVASPPLRSTLGIVWPCVLTLIASVYSALHLDVIADSSATTASPCKCRWCAHLYNRICRDVRSLTVQLGVSTAAFFAPELILQRAILDFMGSFSLQKKLEWKDNVDKQVYVMSLLSPKFLGLAVYG